MKRLAYLAIALFGISLQSSLHADEELNWQKPVIVPSRPQSPTYKAVDDVFSMSDAPLAVGRLVSQADISSYDPVIRAQSPNLEAPYIDPPGGNRTFSQQQPVTIMPPTMGQQPLPGNDMNWPGVPMFGPQMGAPVDAPVMTMWGANGAQPYRMGWSAKWDVGYLSGEKVESQTGLNRGDFGVTELNGELRYTQQLPTQWIFSTAAQYGLRLWDGPDGVGSVPLPGQAHRLALDFGLTTPTQGPYTAELGVTPTIATDFDRNPNSQAWQFDARGALFFRPDPRITWMIGAQYWDRIHDKTLPWAGLIWTPSDTWEIRAIFPNPQISYFLGMPGGIPTWLYVAGEYHIEAYQIGTRVGTGRDQVEIEDWRAVIGVRTENNGVSAFLEGGYIFNRTMDFRTNAQELDIGDGFVARFGMRF